MPPKNHTRPVALWLFACCGMVFIMALLGAVTRLTESGLSITDWNPVMGALPPRGGAAWDKAFAAYRQIPQYQILHRGMTLDEFKGIYFWEWLHRLWGRLIGVVFAAPFVWFLIRRRIDRRAGWSFAAIFALGGLQGFIGWFMVQSGLAVRTSVSPYRLALHLGFALLIYALMLWMGLGMWPSKKIVISREPEAKPRAQMRNDGVGVQGWLTLLLLAVTMVWGAFTAGLHAGEAYNTWPLMEGEVIPGAAWTLLPGWVNAFENLALVQFIHRWLGPLTMIAILGWVARLWRQERRDPPPHKGEGIPSLCLIGTRSPYGVLALGGMAVVQVALGLATLLSHAEIVIATLHQAGAITLLTLMLVNLRRMKHR